MCCIQDVCLESLTATGQGKSKNPSSMCCFQDKGHLPVEAVYRLPVSTPCLENSLTEPGTTRSDITSKPSNPNVSAGGGGTQGTCVHHHWTESMSVSTSVCKKHLSM